MGGVDSQLNNTLAKSTTRTKTITRSTRWDLPKTRTPSPPTTTQPWAWAITSKMSRTLENGVYSERELTFHLFDTIEAVETDESTIHVTRLYIYEAEQNMKGWTSTKSVTHLEHTTKRRSHDLGTGA